ncbi:MAG: hypothetical protein EP349_08815 [Alphaproteobacteria bacterium]|nr:MAG: hypothetical protein EP349_08815 [Alphaproteobacteria bacterium]
MPYAYNEKFDETASNTKDAAKTLEKIFNLLAKQSAPTPYSEEELKKNDGFMKLGKGIIAHITAHEGKFVQMHVFDFNFQIVTTSTDYGHTAASCITKFADMPQKAIQSAQRAAEKLGA